MKFRLFGNISSSQVSTPAGTFDVMEGGVFECDDDCREALQPLVDSRIGEFVEDSENESENTAVPEKDLRKMLIVMKLADLRYFATNEGFPQSEWDNLTKPNLIQYLVEKSESE